MPAGILENHVKMELLINVIEKRKRSDENKDADGGGKAQTGNKETLKS
jgi:hypothetical protein